MAGLCLTAFAAVAQEAQILKSYAEKLPTLRIDEVRPTPVPGVYEVRTAGTEIFYTDAKGQFLIEGSIYDLVSKVNLTEQRTTKLTELEFKNLPMKDAFSFVLGNGKRQLAVFEDPNCGYCKRFEADLQKVTNATVHIFLLPILGQDSMNKSKSIWCSKDRAKAWLDWMVRNVTPTADGSCDTSALERNVALARKHKINGTPAAIFTDNRRVPGAISAQQVEQMLAEASK